MGILRQFKDLAGRIRWRLVSVPIYVKVFGIGLLISLLFASVAFSIMRGSVLRAHYQARGEMALSLATSLAARLQTGGLAKKEVLDHELNQTMASFPSVRYILVQDARGSILSHGFTFPKEAPPDLAGKAGDLCATCHPALSPEELPSQLLEVPASVDLPEGGLRAFRRPEGLILEVTVPVGGGQGGAVRLGVADKKVTQDLALLNRAIVAGIALCLFATLCSAMLLTFVLNKPISALLRATKVVATGNFDARAPVYSDDELGKLAGAFNQMAAGLAESRRRVLRADRLASIGQFAAGVAHEINNPLDGMMSCLRRLQREPANLTQNMEYLEMIQHALERIAGVIQRLLEYSQQRDMNPQPEDIRAIIDNVVALIRVMARHNSVEIAVHVKEDTPRVACDRYHIEQALLNLALNGVAAIDESRHGLGPDAPPGRLAFSARTVTLSDKTRMVQVDVADTGKGILPENLEHIFDTFYTTKEPGKGTGLGLAIVKEIIESHAGSIDVESTVGQGTVFHVLLPVLASDSVRDLNEEVPAA